MSILKQGCFADEPLDKKLNSNWYPATGGTEKEFRTRTGRRLLYCYQPSTGNHAYLDPDTDLILTHEEAIVALELF
jgi:hypothetical protein